MRLIYVSVRQGRDDRDLDAILAASQRRNGEGGITGALVVGERHFLQLLEGRCADLGRCFGLIARDPRHADVQVISAGEARHRLFPDWSMRVVEQSMVMRMILRRLGAADTFSPPQMSQAAVEDLFRRLAVELGEAAPIAPRGSRSVSRPGL
jgi:hypothetical protein